MSVNEISPGQSRETTGAISGSFFLESSPADSQLAKVLQRLTRKRGLIEQSPQAHCYSARPGSLSADMSHLDRVWPDCDSVRAQEVFARVREAEERMAFERRIREEQRKQQAKL